MGYTDPLRQLYQRPWRWICPSRSPKTRIVGTWRAWRRRREPRTSSTRSWRASMTSRAACWAWRGRRGARIRCASGGRRGASSGRTTSSAGPRTRSTGRWRARARSQGSRVDAGERPGPGAQDPYRVEPDGHAGHTPADAQWRADGAVRLRVYEAERAVAGVRDPDAAPRDLQVARAVAHADGGLHPARSRVDARHCVVTPVRHPDCGAADRQALRPVTHRDRRHSAAGDGVDARDGVVGGVGDPHRTVAVDRAHGLPAD